MSTWLFGWSITDAPRSTTLRSCSSAPSLRKCTTPSVPSTSTRVLAMSRSVWTGTWIVTVEPRVKPSERNGASSCWTTIRSPCRLVRPPVRRSEASAAARVMASADCRSSTTTWPSEPASTVTCPNRASSWSFGAEPTAKVVVRWSSASVLASATMLPISRKSRNGSIAAATSSDRTFAQIGTGATSAALLGHEPVANAPHGHDRVAEWPELAAQAPDMGVDRAVEALVVAVPDPLQQEVAAEGPARVGREQHQQVVLLGRQVQRLAVQLGGV